MARDADAILYTRAGWEVGVAATKTHLAQIVAMQVLALYLSQVRHTLLPDDIERIVAELRTLPEAVEGALATSNATADIAKAISGARDFFFIGRGVGYPVALEGALKLKEISYLRAEGYPGGELKHGPIALIEPGTIVVGIATKGRLLQKLLSNIQEVKARGATIILIVTEGDTETAAQADYAIEVPATHELFSPAVDNVPLQLLAYHLAKARGTDVDKPRNLAKTVTVE
jgi:glucosamine--fructose-6-phosphate aminotransferase (isomerizing)